MFEKSDVVFSAIASTEETWPIRLISKHLSQPRERAPDLKPFIGNYIGCHGKQQFWNLAEPGKKQLKTLKDQVKALLDSHNEGLKERESCTVLLELFMVGRSEDQSYPTLVIICAKKAPRNKVAEVIRKSKILDKFDGVLLGAASRDPRYLGMAQSIASGPEGWNVELMPPGTKVYIKSFGSKSNLGGGTSVYIPMDEYVQVPRDKHVLWEGNVLDDLGRFQKATIGGFLTLTSKDGIATTVRMTVAHAFEPLRPDEFESLAYEEFDDGDFEFEFVGTPKDSLSGSDSSVAPSSSSAFSHLRVDTLTQSDLAVHFTIEHYSELEEFGTLYSTSTIRNSSNLDWAVIQSVSPNLEFSNGKNGIEVGTCTSSKMAAVGRIKGSSTLLKMERSRIFEEVWTIEFDGCLEYGDSGSWVVEPISKRICGHIIAGHPGQGVAYISPGERTFRDIETKLDCHIELATEADVVSGDVHEKVPQLRSRESEREASEASQMDEETNNGLSEGNLPEQRKPRSVSLEGLEEMLGKGGTKEGIQIYHETITRPSETELLGQDKSGTVSTEQDGEGSNSWHRARGGNPVESPINSNLHQKSAPAKERMITSTGQEVDTGLFTAPSYSIATPGPPDIPRSFANGGGGISSEIVPLASPTVPPQGHQAKRSWTATTSNRRKLSKALTSITSIGHYIGTAARGQFGDSQFKLGKALNFPEIPGEEYRNSALPQVMEQYNQHRDADGNVTTVLLERPSRASSFTGSVASGLGIESSSTTPRAAPPRPPTRLNEYFVPRHGIDPEVITADICQYLGSEALVRLGPYENPQTRQVQQGYFITAYNNPTTAIIADLKADSERWDAERRQITPRGQSLNVDYRASITHQARLCFGPTETTVAHPSYRPPTSSTISTMYTSYSESVHAESYSTSLSTASYATPVAGAHMAANLNMSRPNSKRNVQYNSTPSYAQLDSHLNYSSSTSLNQGDSSQKASDSLYRRPSPHDSQPGMTQPNELAPNAPDSGSNKLQTEQEQKTKGSPPPKLTEEETHLENPRMIS